MNFKKIILTTSKILLLTIILMICIIISALISGIAEPPADGTVSQNNNSSTMSALLISSLFESIVLSYIIIRAQGKGIRLIGAVSLAFYGSMTFIAQLESIVYLPDKLPNDLIPKLFIMGFIIVVLFTPIAVIILGKMKKNIAVDNQIYRNVMPKSEWFLKIFSLVIIYLILYYTFGYYIAWKNPAVLAYYGGTDPGNIFAQLKSIWQATPWMFPFQAFRAFLWILIVIPLVKMLKGSSLEIGLMMAMFFSVWSLQLLAPNPYMPSEVSSVHLIETVSSNFIFGFILGWMLSMSHYSKQNVAEQA
jgi:hypothetical protein